MPTRPIRRFTLLDAMVLLAATGVGLIGIRLRLIPSLNRITLSHLWQTLREERSAIAALDLLEAIVPYTKPLLAAWTLAAVLLRLLPPHPPLRRLVFQPGMAACLVASFGAVLSFVDAMLRIAWKSVLVASRPDAADWLNSLSWKYFLMRSLRDSGPAIGFGILGIWALMILGRRWRPERTWIDRTGRALGVLWITSAAVEWLPGLLHEFDIYLR